MTLPPPDGGMHGWVPPGGPPRWPWLAKLLRYPDAGEQESAADDVHVDDGGDD